MKKTMKKSTLSKIIAIIICSLCFGYYSSALGEATVIEEQVVFARNDITILTANAEYKYNAEIAASEKQLEIGLMQRSTLPENEAMLFIFPENTRVNMWMKNTIIPLDMLFIDRSGKIIYIVRDTKPESLDIINAGNVFVRAVLEIKGGTSKAKNINVGDKVIYKVFEE